MKRPDPIKVTVTDPDTGQLLEEKTIRDSYVLVCHGNHCLSGEQYYPSTGTVVLTIKRMEPT